MLEVGMKKILLLVTFILTTCLSYSQEISDVSISGTVLTVRDENNNVISNYILSYGDELCGFSSTIIVIKNQTVVRVYDQKFNSISNHILSYGDKVKNVSGNNIIVKNGNVITTYDKKFNVVSTRIE